jgi:hypothetical protein
MTCLVGTRIPDSLGTSQGRRKKVSLWRTHQGILLYDWDGRKSSETRGQFETSGIDDDSSYYQAVPGTLKLFIFVPIKKNLTCQKIN